MQKNKSQLQQWFAKFPGSAILEAESKTLSRLLSKVFGYHLLQLGWITQHDWLKHSRISHHIYLTPIAATDFPGTYVQGSFTDLPFLPDSIDAVLLPHILEFVDNPQQVLQEVDQVLMPEGRVIILGFHPWSLFGLTRLFKNHKQLPWRGKFHSSYRVRAWLREQGYMIEEEKTLFFRPLLQNGKTLQKLLFLEAVGQLIWPYLGSVYFIVAKKRVARVIPMRSSLLAKRVRVPHGVTQPTARANNQAHE
jgi:SAM-dependent methyltransferase